MDKVKLEISGKKTNSSESLTAIYKPIPESDVEEEALSSRPKSLVKSTFNNYQSVVVNDGANEKMISPSSDEEKIPEVVVFNNDAKSPQNGDAKLEISESKQVFVGLTKEELMKYSNDPFWVRLRWFLFISFWILWSLMLLGAILIIYGAPKCDPPPPRTWYQQGPIAEISSQDSSNILEEKLQIDEQIQGLIVPWINDAFSPLDGTNNKADGLEKRIKSALKITKNVIVELDPTSSRVWFEKSEKKDPNYDGYYIWKSGILKGSTNGVLAPNNWVSPFNISSWKYSDARKEFYYSPFNRPHLNYRNVSVIQEFSRVIETILALNVSGIRLKNARYLLVDSKFENQEYDTSNTDLNLAVNHYKFYQHSRTEDLPELGGLLKHWRSLIKNKTENGPLMIAEELGQVQSYKVNGSLVIDMPLKSHIFSKSSLFVEEMANSLNYTFNIDGIEWPLWKAQTDALPKDVLDIITYLLPGAPFVNLTEKINPALIKLRNSPSIMRGIVGVYTMNNNTILAFIRVTPGSPGIFVAVNPTNATKIANIPQEIGYLSTLQEVTVRYYSNNYNESNFMDIGAKRSATDISVSAKSAIVLEYVPKKED